MKKCPKCGYPNPDTRIVCFKCHTGLKSSEPVGMVEAHTQEPEEESSASSHPQQTTGMPTMSAPKTPRPFAWVPWVFVGIFILFAFAAVYEEPAYSPTTDEEPPGSPDSRFEMVGYHESEGWDRMPGKHRVVSVYTDTVDPGAIRHYAENVTHHDGDATGVLFFSDRENTPDVTQVGLDYPKRYDPYLIAVHWRLTNGETTFLSPTECKSAK